ncbi:MAG: hypothetical protein GY839_17840 [candidate division Zixibacteria bacterium]|nr:hypothetical protein [candidate division Zixibacteria bacterium]
MSLQSWLNDGWLSEHKTSFAEIDELFSVVDRDLKDCRVSELSPDWRLNIAYNAALQASTAALAACGFRAARDSHHYRVIQSLAYTIKAEKNLILQFDRFRKKRNIGGYVQAGMFQCLLTFKKRKARQKAIK